VRAAHNVLIRACALAIALLLATATVTTAQSPTLSDAIESVVRIKTFINPEARTQDTLGREREGSGVVIDSGGLVLTIGYLMLEAHAAELTTRAGRRVAAEVVGYDHDTGFGLLRATASLDIKPMPLGSSAALKDGARMLIAAGGRDEVGGVEVVARREFAGYWEYLLESAIFTAPPVPWWSGAALIGEDGRLVGIGSLIVGDAKAKGGDPEPGNMFVPIDLLPPILGELIGSGRVSGAPRPWLGITTHEIGGHLLVARVVPGGPAEKAGVAKGDLVAGVDGARVATLSALYRAIWAKGNAGVVVPLDIVRDGETQRIAVTSANRRAHLRLKSTF
jgi:S1-C subfamily serine protease